MSQLDLHLRYCQIRWGQNICPHCRCIGLLPLMDADRFKCAACNKYYSVLHGTALEGYTGSIEDMDRLLSDIAGDAEKLYRSQYKANHWKLLLNIWEIHNQCPPVVYKELRREKNAYRSRHVKYIKTIGGSKEDLFRKLVDVPPMSFSHPIETLEYDKSVIKSWETDKHVVLNAMETIGEMNHESDVLLSQDEVNLIVTAIQDGIAIQRARGVDEKLLQLHTRCRNLAQETIIQRNKGLLVTIANDITNSNDSIPFDDCLQECCLALLDVIQYFNPDMGYKLSTYIVNPIKHRVVAAIGKQDRAIYLPKQKRQDIANYINAEKKLANEMGRMPSLDELIHHMMDGKYNDQEFNKVKQYIDDLRKTAWLDPISLDARVYNEDGEADNDMYNYVASESGSSHDVFDEDIVEDAAHVEVMGTGMESVIDRHMEVPFNEVVKLYYGIGKTREYSTVEIVDVFNSNEFLVRKYNNGNPFNGGRIQQIIREARQTLAQIVPNPYCP